MRADVAQSGEVRAMLSRAVETYGRTDCAVNNAGISADFPLVARPMIIFAMERSISLAVGPLRLCRTPMAAGDKRLPMGGAESASWERSTARR